MFDRLAMFVLKRPWRILLGVLILAVILGGASGSRLNPRLTSGGYDARNSQSAAANEALLKKFGQGAPNLVVLVSDPRGVDSSEVAAAGVALTKKLAAESGVKGVGSYWTLGKPAALRSRDGRQAIVLGTITGNFNTMLKKVKTLAPEYTGRAAGLTVKAGGVALMWQENIQEATKDVTKAELLTFPLILLVLILVFDSAMAAFLPLVVATGTILFVMPFVLGLSYVMQLSNFVTNVTTFMGLGLAIDYSLLLIRRYREELGRGRDIPDAIRASVRTAGRTVFFSAITVAVAFSATLVLPFTVFTSLAAAAIFTALLAAVMALLLIPALLAVLGPRVDKFRIPLPYFRRRQPVTAETENGGWHRLAMFVMRRPIPVAAAVLVIVVVLGLPALHMQLRLPDQSILPAGAQAAQVANTTAANFNSREQQEILVVAPNSGNPAAHAAAIASYAQELSALPHVQRVDALTGSYEHGHPSASPGLTSLRFAAKDSTYLSVVPAVDGYSNLGRQLVGQIRAAPAPFHIIVGGTPAESADTFNALYRWLPLAGLILVVGMYVLLFLLTGSVLLPIIAIVLSTLTLSATFGALVFIFQEGHLRSLVGNFVVTGAITWTAPITIFALAFGLAMDYQVFMFSRIREEYLRTGDNTAAVATGLERVGRVVTYAAVLMSVVFVVWSTSGLSYMKAIGIGLPLAILMDATLIRGALLPAFMRLSQRWCWWSPKFLSRVRLSEGPGGEPAAVGGGVGATAEVGSAITR
jgi:RND superfamily putative drug exporter